MPALIHIEDNHPVGWITAPDMATLFNRANGTDIRNNAGLMDKLYFLRDSVGSVLDDGEPKRELEPGFWLLLD